MKISIDIDKCVGGGQCVVAAPDVFDQDDDGLVIVLDGDPPEQLNTDVQMAATLCPARVISVDES